MLCARTISFAFAAVIAITSGHQFSYAAEKGARLRPAPVRSDHILMVPLDATGHPAGLLNQLVVTRAARYRRQSATLCLSSGRTNGCDISVRG
ncbi:UNVERIFIED_ORG: hypothetical protein GGE44_001875 [Rhizobium esperanzae]